jgi:signal transduction histidine kinase
VPDTKEPIDDLNSQPKGRRDNAFASLKNRQARVVSLFFGITASFRTILRENVFRKLFVRSLAISGVIGIVGLAAVLLWGQGYYKDHVQEDARRFASAVADGIENGASEEARARARLYVDALVAIEGVAFAEIRIGDAVLANRGDSSTRSILVVQGAGKSGEQAPIVRIAFSRTFLQSQAIDLFGTVLPVALGVLLASVATGVFMYHFLASRELRLRLAQIGVQARGAADNAALNDDADPVWLLAMALREARLEIERASRQEDELKAEVKAHERFSQKAETILMQAIDGLEASVAIFTQDGICLETNRSFAEEFPLLSARVAELEKGLEYKEFRDGLTEEGLVNEHEIEGDGNLETTIAREARQRTTTFRRGKDGFYRRTIAPLAGNGWVVSFVNLTQLEAARRDAAELAKLIGEGFALLEAGLVVWTQEGALDRVIAIPGQERGPSKDQRVQRGMTIDEFIRVTRDTNGVEIRNLSTTVRGRTWAQDMPLDARLRSWERALEDGRRFHTRMKKRDNGGYMIVTADVSEAVATRQKAEIQTQIAAAAFNTMPASYEYWNAKQELQEWHSTLGEGARGLAVDSLRRGLLFPDYYALIISEELPDDRERSDLHEGRAWTDNIPLEGRVGIWEREKSDGTYLRTTVVQTREGGYLIVTVDLTTTREAQRRVEASERTLKEIVHALGAYWCTFSQNGRLSLWGDNADLSPVWAKHQRKLFHGMTHVDFLRVMTSEGAVEDLRLTDTRDGVSYEEQVDLAQKIGTWKRATRDGRFLQTIVARLSTGGYAIATQDMTTQERARALAKQAEETISEIVHLIEVGFQIWSPDQQLVSWREARSESLLIGPGAQVGMSVREMADLLRQFGLDDEPGKSRRSKGLLFTDIEDLNEALGTWDRRLKNGLFVRTKVTRLSDGSFAVVTQNLTELENIRNAAAQNEKLASLGGLVAGISHEINTPLGVAVTSVSLIGQTASDVLKRYIAGTLSEDDLKSDLQRMIEASELLERNIERAAGLVSNFKQVAVDQTIEGRREIDVRAYVVDAAKNMTPMWRKTPHRFLVEKGDPIFANIYPGALAQIVTNLSTNAITHAFSMRETAGVAKISIADDDTHVILTYSDNGVGLTQEAHKRILEPFFTTKRGNGGTGLGMTIVHNLVTRNLGGTIEIGAPGDGMRITIRFPKVSPREITP